MNIIDIENKNWILCNYNAPNYFRWLCSLQHYTRQSKKTKFCFGSLLTKLENMILYKNDLNSRVETIETQLSGNEEEENPNTTSKIPSFSQNNLEESIIVLPTNDKICNENWDYNQMGDDWECQCKEGKRQSPINICTERAKLSPIKPVFEYSQVNFQRDSKKKTTVDKLSGDGLKIMYHQYRIKIFSTNFGNLIDLNGSVFQAEEITFHTPSEHTIDGKRFDLELQILHYGITRGDIAKQAMLCFLFKASPGKYNNFFESIDFFNLPNKKVKVRELHVPLNINDIFSTGEEIEDKISEIDLLKSDPTSNLFNSKTTTKKISEDFVKKLPKTNMDDFSFYSYEGSLTFPPCSERTTVYVAEEPILISNTIIKLFQEALNEPDYLNKNGGFVLDHNKITNVRRTQSLNNRDIFYYDRKLYGEAKFEINKKDLSHGESNGHYEKLYREITSYYYVKGQEPSDIPGSLLVSEQEALKNIDLKKADFNK